MKNVTKKPAAGKPVAGKKKKSPKRKNPQKAKKPLIQKLISLLRKRIKQKQRLKPKNEYRYNHDTGHINYIFAETENKNKSVGITKHDTTFGKKNMPLKRNPKKNQKPGEVKKSYVRNGIISDNKESYSKKVAKNVQFSPDDKANVKAKIRNYKKMRKHKTIKEKENE